MPDETRNTLPPLPPDAADRTFMLIADRAALPWLELPAPLTRFRATE